MRGGKQPRVLFATQAGIKPPHFVLFTTGFLEETYRRFIERRLREDFGFAGTPVKLTMRLREKRGKNAGGGPKPGAQAEHPPGMIEDLLEVDRRRVWHPYGPMPGTQPPLVVESAAGVRLRLARRP